MNIVSRVQTLISQIMSDPIQVVLRILAIVLALSVHEFAHAYIADKNGDPTARSLGRMTINPLKHIDPIGFVCMIFLGFGWAKPVPVNPNNYRNRRKGTLTVSLAGVATNFICAFISVMVYVGLMKVWMGMESPPEVLRYALSFFWLFASLNLSFMVFNLLPIPPLDGYQVVKELLIGKINLNWLWNYERYGSLIMLVLLLTGLIGYILTPAYNLILDGLMNLATWIFF